MARSERQGITGSLTIVLRDQSGQVLDTRRVHNLITQN